MYLGTCFFLIPLLYLGVFAEYQNLVDSGFENSTLERLALYKMNYLTWSSLKLKNAFDFFRNGGITAVLNEYADKLLTDIQAFLVQNGFDPYQMENKMLKVNRNCCLQKISLRQSW